MLCKLYSLCILTNCIVSLWIPIRSFCRCVSGYSFIISSNRNSCSNSMNFSRTFFSWISFKKVSDCLVFHQSLTQGSRHLLNERETHQGKNTIDARYGRKINTFFFFFSLFFFFFWIVNFILSDISLNHEFYNKVWNLWIYSPFLYNIPLFSLWI